MRPIAPNTRLIVGASVGILALALAGLGVLAETWRQIDSPEHVALECELVAALEKQRLLISDDFGPAPLEWRRAEAVEGPPRGWRTDRATSLKHRLIGAVLQFQTPHRAGPIACAATMDRAHVPLFVGNTERRRPDLLDTFGRARYSRAVFTPGGSYAIVSRTFCDVTRRGGEAWNTGWDQETRTELWRRDGPTWVMAEPRPELAIWRSPRHRLPARCFDPDIPG